MAGQMRLLGCLSAHLPLHYVSVRRDRELEEREGGREGERERGREGDREGGREIVLEATHRVGTVLGQRAGHQ